MYVRHTLLWREMSQNLTQRSGNPLTLVSICQVSLPTVIIIGRWSRNTFLWYIQIQISYLRKVISDLIVNTQASYRIPEAEIVYPASNLTGYSHNEESQITLLPPY